MSNYLYDMYKVIVNHLYKYNVGSHSESLGFDPKAVLSTQTRAQTQGMAEGMAQGMAEDVSGYTILNPPALFYVNEMMEKVEIYRILSKNKNYHTLRFIVSPHYSCYLFCYWMIDLLDILSNELFFLESKIEIYFEEQVHASFINEFKDFLRKSIPTLQRNKILPLYAKFILDPSFHVENSVSFNTRFHILFLKENLNYLSVQRIHFNIDL